MKPMTGGAVRRCQSDTNRADGFVFSAAGGAGDAAGGQTIGRIGYIPGAPRHFDRGFRMDGTVVLEGFWRYP